MTDLEYATQEALARRTFYMAIACGSVAGKYSYVQLYNPADSGVNVMLDQFFLWGGHPVASSEHGINYFSTPLDNPGIGGEYRGHLVSTMYPNTMSKACLYLAAHTQVLGLRGPYNLPDYVVQTPKNDGEVIDHRLPYPIILAPNTGILFWHAAAPYEEKVGLWIREQPV